ncbi:hypothetical protein ABI59_21135 [Acidobacteria bacterium Mor1]|nr:hypothetical protein ABI59_21135 [Acidobacteria bacterium Mor1]
MSRTVIAGSAAALLLLLVLVLAGYRLVQQALEPDTAHWPAITPQTPRPEHPGYLYGVVTTTEGNDHQGYLRFGGDQEAFWSDAFNGFKPHNPWAEHLSGQEEAPKPAQLERPFMTRFGNLTRIDIEGRDVRVTLKSGTRVLLDRHEAGDIDDGVRVWVDGTRVVDLEARAIRQIEFRPAPGGDAAPTSRLHGTVRTGDGSFRGFIQWNRLKRLGSDRLVGRSDKGRQAIPFDDIASIERDGDSGCRIRLQVGDELSLEGEPDVNRRNRGLVVDDSRYGRVLIPWNQVEGVDLTPGDDSPAYSDFKPGSAIQGSVETRQGASHGRLVFDLDESETTDTLDAPAKGVTYTVPFGRIRSIARDPASDEHFIVDLDGGPLRLEARGDLAGGNGGMLVFPVAGGPAQYIPWPEVRSIEIASKPKLRAPDSEGQVVE